MQPKTSEKKQYDVIVAGHICLDITPTFPGGGPFDLEKAFRPGRLLKVSDAVIGTGGAVSNAGIALSKLGLKTAFISGIGDDYFGRIIESKMAQFGTVEGLHCSSRAGSSYSVILAPPGIDRIILHNPGCNDEFSREHIDWELVAQGRLFHFGYPPIMRKMYQNTGRELAYILKKVKSLGLATSVDMALPDPNSEAGKLDWQAWFENVLPHVDIFMPSIEEMLLFCDRKQWQTIRGAAGDFTQAVPQSLYPELAGRVLRLGCALVVLKAGSRGLYARTATRERIAQAGIIAPGRQAIWAERELWALGFTVNEIKSATGAGDSAVAGILTAILRGKGIEETLQFGNCLGLQNLRALDTTSGIGTYAETEALIRSLKPISGDFLDDSWKETGWRGVREKV